MRLKKICRIESYPNRTKYDYCECEWNDFFYLDLRYGKRRWFDGGFNPINNPLENDGYDIRKFYKEVDKAWNSVNKSSCYVEDNKEEEFDIMFEDTDIFPVNKYAGIDCYKMICEQ